MNARLLLALSLGLAAPSGRAADAPSNEPRYNRDGHLLLPGNYREWIFLSAGLGMTYGTPKPNAAPRFDNVFVTPEAYRAFLQSGAWPDKTMFILEVRASASEGSINKGGHYQADIVKLEAHVKDEARFPKKWAFFDFERAAPAAKPLGADSSCQKCHEKNGAVEQTFVQFYPSLIAIAKAKGTYRKETER